MIRRKIKNVVKNFSEVEIVVREATSNESWGPSNSILVKIAILSSVDANLIKIMPIIWKRLKDTGKKWRHVYKSLILLEFLITRGNPSISENCKQNIHFLQSLEQFTYQDNNVDVGSRIRKRAEALVALLKDGDLLRMERNKAAMTEMRLSKAIVSQGSNVPIKYGNGIGSLNQGPSSGSFKNGDRDQTIDPMKSDHIVPTSTIEEDIHLQIALAESQETETKRKQLEEIDNLTDQYKLSFAFEKNFVDNNLSTEFLDPHSSSSAPVPSAPRATVAFRPPPCSGFGSSSSVAVNAPISMMPPPPPSLPSLSSLSLSIGKSKNDNGDDEITHQTGDWAASGAVGLVNKQSLPSNQRIRFENDPWSPVPLEDNNHEQFPMKSTSAVAMDILNNPWSFPKGKLQTEHDDSNPWSALPMATSDHRSIQSRSSQQYLPMTTAIPSDTPFVDNHQPPHVISQQPSSWFQFKSQPQQQNCNDDNNAIIQAKMMSTSISQSAILPTHRDTLLSIVNDNNEDDVENVEEGDWPVDDFSNPWSIQSNPIPRKLINANSIGFGFDFGDGGSKSISDGNGANVTKQKTASSALCVGYGQKERRTKTATTTDSVVDFLANHSHLVDFDNIITVEQSARQKPTNLNYNPFHAHVSLDMHPTDFQHKSSHNPFVSLSPGNIQTYPSQIDWKGSLDESSPPQPPLSSCFFDNIISHSRAAAFSPPSIETTGNLVKQRSLNPFQS